MKSYSESFQTDEAVTHYEDTVYSADSYDSFIWKIQSKQLSAIFNNLNENHKGLEHLDYASGTGRIISFVENLTENSTGLDISDKMISVARKKVKQAKFYVADLSKNPEICNSPYDVITAFRFFLNAEPEVRTGVMTALASRLKGPKSRLVFDVHGNLTSLRHVTIKLRPKSGERINEMSYGEARQLVEDAGLEIESCYGFGVIPPGIHRSPLAPVARILDRIFTQLPFMTRVSYDMLFVCKKIDIEKNSK